MPQRWHSSIHTFDSFLQHPMIHGRRCDKLQPCPAPLVSIIQTSSELNSWLTLKFNYRRGGGEERLHNEGGTAKCNKKQKGHMLRSLEKSRIKLQALNYLQHFILPNLSKCSTCRNSTLIAFAVYCKPKHTIALS